MKLDLALQLLTLSALSRSCAALPQQLGAATSGPFAGGVQKIVNSRPGRRLTGKFLHITDIHPDPYYKTYSSTLGEDACHRHSGPAGYYGAETSDCDSPIALLDATFKWINDTIRDEIDFVIWTGDSARHDNDEQIPRSEKQVVSQNELVVQKFREVFGTGNGVDPSSAFTIPIIPTLGNNDILPHNIFEEGPNRWTRRYLETWRSFIPEEQRHQFARGGWFFVEAIPNKLAIFSLNTLYFFDSNSAVDGCADKNEPGYEHFEWLRIQLQILRERGMKAMLIGHVPPAKVASKMSWDETCWQKYTLWQQQYRDVIVGNFYGHMNIDHFMLQDFHDIDKSYRTGYGTPFDAPQTRDVADEELSVLSATDYLNDLRAFFSKIPAVGEILRPNDTDSETKSWSETLWGTLRGGKNKKGKKKHGKGKKKHDALSKIGGEFGERYSLSFVQASVVPNFFPTLRVFEYNTTGLNAHVYDTSQISNIQPGMQLQSALQAPEKSLSFIEEFASDIVESSRKAKDPSDKSRKNKKKRKYKFKVPKPPSKIAPPGPAYSSQTFSLLGYTQYYANITFINNDFLRTESWVDSSEQQLGGDIVENEEDIDEQRWKPGKHHGKTKKGKPHPKKFKFKVEYSTFKDKIFGLKDLTVRSYIDLAKVIGDSKKADGKDVTMQEEEEKSEHDDDGDDAQVLGGKSEKKKAKHRSNKVWHTFIRRAFVGTIDPQEIENRFLAWSTANATTDDTAGGNSTLIPSGALEL